MRSTPVLLTFSCNCRYCRIYASQPLLFACGVPFRARARILRSFTKHRKTRYKKATYYVFGVMTPVFPACGKHKTTKTFPVFQMPYSRRASPFSQLPPHKNAPKKVCDSLILCATLCVPATSSANCCVQTAFCILLYILVLCHTARKKRLLSPLPLPLRFHEAQRVHCLECGGCRGGGGILGIHILIFCNGIVFAIYCIRV